MGIDECYNREMSILDEQLASGEIDRKEYDSAVRELEVDMRGPAGLSFKDESWRLSLGAYHGA